MKLKIKFRIKIKSKFEIKKKKSTPWVSAKGKPTAAVSARWDNFQGQKN